MKIALALVIAFLTFIGITKAATDQKAPRVYIVAKFVEITEKEPAPPGGAGAPLPAPLDAGTSKPGLLGVLTDSEFQVILRDLSQRKGVDLMSAPSVTARGGQQAKVEVVREFIYPDGLGPRLSAKKPIEADVGVTLEVRPGITAEKQIALDLASQVVEFEGFESIKNDRDEEPLLVRKLLHHDGSYTEYTSVGEKGEVLESKFDAQGVLLTRKTVPSSKGGASTQPTPIFSKRRTSVNAVITSGHTMVLNMESRTDKQTVEETDGAGRVISSGVELFRRRLFVFVTACLIDPAGQPRDP